MGPKVRAEAKGVALIIAPFNFPCFLLLSPLVSLRLRAPLGTTG